MNKAYGEAASVFGGGANSALGASSVAVGGLQSTVNGTFAVGIAGGSTNADYALAAGNGANVTVKNGTAIGYQATTDEAGTIAFGHDKGDVSPSAYTVTWEKRTDNQKNADGTDYDYTKPIVTANTKKNYEDAYYNRLVKVADGKDDHDVVVMEQLNNAKNDLKVNAGWGISVADVKTPNNDGTETTTKNVISLNRNLGTNYGNPWKGEGKATFEAGGQNSLILGGAASILFHNEADNVRAGAYGKDSVLVGGFNNLIDKNDDDIYKIQTGEDAVIVGGDTNKVTGLRSVIVGGYQNKVSGAHSIVIGGASNETDGGGAGVFGGQSNKAAGAYSSVLGGDHNEADGARSSAIGGTTNTASGLYATTLGGESNFANGEKSVTIGGGSNLTLKKDSTVIGGGTNIAGGPLSFVGGGGRNHAMGRTSTALGGEGSSVNAVLSTGIAGGSTEEKAMLSLAAGYQSVVTDTGLEWRTPTEDEINKYNQKLLSGEKDPSWPGFSGIVDRGDDGDGPVHLLDRISTAVGYQATADAPGVIAFGHDKGDVASVAKKWKQKATVEYIKTGDNDYDVDLKYYDANHKEISAEEYYKLANPDGTWNDYTKDPVEEKTTYTSSYYNRLVKAADGIDAHDAVVMEQLKPYTKSDASNIGSNLKTYTVGDDGETITEAEASDADKTKNENAWGAALGTGKVADPKAEDAKKNGSQQLVTGGTVYNALQKQKNDLTNSLSVNAGWGINIDKNNGNTISLKRNLGKEISLQDKETKATLEVSNTSLILGGEFNAQINSKWSGSNSEWGARGQSTVLVGGANNLADGEATAVFGGVLNKSTGLWSTVSGGAQNLANGEAAAVFGGIWNKATGRDSAVFGGANNSATEGSASVFGGNKNMARGYGSVVSGGVNNEARAYFSTVIGGSRNATQDFAPSKNYNTNERGYNSTIIGGYENSASGEYSLALGGNNSFVSGRESVGIAGGTTGNDARWALAAGNQSVVTVENGTAIGYNATTDEQNTIAFGHDKGDVSGYTVTWKQKATTANGKYYNANGTEITKEQYDALENPDGTYNDYTQDPKIETNTYTSAYYNRLVKAADGKDAHDVVVMEQLKPYTKSDASNIGANLKTYTVGNDGETITEAEASADEKNTNENAWGAALGTGKIADPNAEDAKKNGSQQLVTGGTVFKETRISAKDEKGQDKHYNYLDANASAGKNLETLDSALKTVSTTAGAHTALTVEGNTPAGTQDEKTKQDVYAGKNILLHESTDKDGKVTYDLKLAKDINIGKPGKDGEDGKIGIDGKDGHIGLNGSDGITVRGLDGENGAPGKDGVTITGPKGEAGKDGIDGKVGISGKDGKDAVSISGKDGVGHIGLTGPAGTNGKDGASIDITVKNGYDDKDKGINGTNGVDGKDGITRIVYTDKTGEHQVATLEDGLKFKGDDTTVINKKLNNTLEIVGGAKGDLTEGNIGVNSTKDGKLKVQLSKDLTGMNSTTYTTTTGEGDSATTSTTVVNGNGLTITNGPSITKDGINGGGDKITHVGSGIEKDATGNITEASKTNAANIGDVQTIAENTATNLTGKGLKFAANSGAEYTAKLGTTVKIQGTAKKADHEYTADNLTTEIDGNGNITILMDKDMSVEKLAVNGKDGKEGQPGTPGSIGIKGQDGESGIGIDGKDGISIKGKDGKDGVTMKAVDGENGTEGHIGLTGPAGTNGINGADGKPGTSIDITVKNGYDGTAGTDGKDGVKGEKGVDGTSLTRIVYTDKTGEHQVATMEDGLKFKGDDDKVIAKKLNNTMEIIGGAKGDLTEGNIGVNSTKDGKLKVQLSKDLTGMNSTTYTTTTGEGDSATTSTTVVNGNGLTITNGPSITNQGVDGGNKVITNVGSGIEKDANGKYTVTDQNKGNAANIGDVQNMVNDAKTELTDGANGLNKKANIDASNIGTNLKNADGSVASADAQKANAEKWGKAIGTGEIKADDGRMVTGKTVYDEVRPKEDGNYVKKDKTTGENLSALDSKIGKLDETKTYNYIDSGKDVSISDNLTKLDTQVKKNADDITSINKSISTLDQNAVKYDDSSKSKISLGGEGGTTITNVKDGALNDNSTDAVNGRQLNAVQKQVTNNTNEITKIKNGEGFTDAGKTVIKNLSKDAVQIKAGDRIKVDEATDKNTGNKTYTISANNNGTVTKGDGNLISGDTLYKEVHIDKDGSYIRSGNTVGQNLSALDSGLKTTSDLIHTNENGDTIQIGGNSTATKIDVSGKDKDGNTTGRVITGVVTDGKDLTSAANVGYVNGITSANTQQIYRDMNNAYSRLDTNINRAAAGSNALAALHPLDFDPADKASFSVGYGHYHNANAAAIGAFYQPNANTMVNMGISLGNGDPGFNAGVSFKLGKGSAYNGVSKAEMAQTIHDQAEEISAIKANDAAKDKRIDALEKENQEMKKQIQEILSRLNG